MPVANVRCNPGQISDFIQLDMDAYGKPQDPSLLAFCSPDFTGAYDVEVSNDPPTKTQGLSIVTNTAPVAHWVAHERMKNMTKGTGENLGVRVQYARINGTNILTGYVNLGIGM